MTADRDDGISVSQISGLLDANADRFIELSRAIWNAPELAFQEYRAAGLLSAQLEAAGFVVERQLGNLETAFRASWGDPTAGPTVAILCEYDALRGVGHACGHNLIAAGGVAAAWALRQLWPDLPGCLQVIGTPAEEDGGGKILLLEQGIFEQVDAALMFHPTSGASKVHRGGLACQELTVSFHGQAAHASSAPWNGVNALDAMLHFYGGIAMLRQQLQPDARLHGVITDGGTAPNVIPEFTRTEFLVRAEKSSYLRSIMNRVEQIAEAAAMATGCSFGLDRTMFYENRINNMALARVFEKHLVELGEAVEEPEPGGGVGSSDIGNVSRVCPTIHPYVSISRQHLTTHTAEFREAAGSEIGQEQMLVAAKALAATAGEVFAAPNLLQRAKAELAESLASERTATS